jgi:hypothetical protein
MWLSSARKNSNSFAQGVISARGLQLRQPRIFAKRAGLVKIFA